MSIDVEKIKAEISAQIKICDAYLKRDPDPDAQQRVAELEKNPCSSGLYYLNAIYKDGYVENAPHNIYETQKVGYDEQRIDGYIIIDNGLWTKDTLSGTPNVLPSYLDQYINDKTVYIDYSKLSKIFQETLDKTHNDPNNKRSCILH